MKREDNTTMKSACTNNNAKYQSRDPDFMINEWNKKQEKQTTHSEKQVC